MDYPRFRAAAVQAAPVFLDTDATVAKACSLIAEAGAAGAQLVVFPEVFVPGYPYWNWTMTPIAGSAWFEKLFKAAVDIPGPHIDRLCSAARDAGAYVVIGVNERDPFSMGTLYNTLVFISDTGDVLGTHRKLVPTWAEKLTWAGGDGSSLRVYDTGIGRLGGLARVNLAAGKLPQPGQGLALGPLRQKHAAIGVDQGHGRDKDDLHER